MIRLFGLFWDFKRRRKWILINTFFLSIYSFLLFKIRPTWIRFGQLNRVEKKSLPIDWELVKDIKFSIYAISKWMPFQLVCRHQAHVAKILFNQYKIPYQLFIGFRKEKIKVYKAMLGRRYRANKLQVFVNPRNM